MKNDFQLDAWNYTGCISLTFLHCVFPQEVACGGVEPTAWRERSGACTLWGARWGDYPTIILKLLPKLKNPSVRVSLEFCESQKCLRNRSIVFDIKQIRWDWSNCRKEWQREAGKAEFGCSALMICLLSQDLIIQSIFLEQVPPLPCLTLPGPWLKAVVLGCTILSGQPSLSFIFS